MGWQTIQRRITWLLESRSFTSVDTAADQPQFPAGHPAHDPNAPHIGQPQYAPGGQPQYPAGGQPQFAPGQPPYLGGGHPHLPVHYDALDLDQYGVAKPPARYTPSVEEDRLSCTKFRVQFHTSSRFFLFFD